MMRRAVRSRSDVWDAASFIQAVKKLIETPVLLLADNL